MQVLRESLDRDTLVTLDGASTGSWFRYGFQAYHPVLSHGDYGALGTGFCMALAVKLAMPHRQVVSINGDGAFMFVVQELATAVGSQIPVVAVIVRNDAYGNMKAQQYAAYGGRYLGTDLCLPHFAELARAFGAHGERVETPEEIRPALRRALAYQRPALVEVVVSKSMEELMASPGFPEA